MPKFKVGDRGTTTNWRGGEGACSFEVVAIKPINGRTQLILLMEHKQTGHQFLSQREMDGTSRHTKGSLLLYNFPELRKRA